MAQYLPRQVPQFGNWEESNDVPFTTVFENARAGRGSAKIVNPNVPLANHTSFGINAQQSETGGDPIKVPEMDQEKSRGRQEQPYESSVGHLARWQSGDGLGTADESLSHQVSQTQPGNRVGSPHRERKILVEPGTTIAPGTPRRSRFGPGSDTPDRGAALPQFGAWEKDPSAADNFSAIFSQARNEKKTGGALRLPPSRLDSPAKTDTQTLKGQGQKKFSNGGCCCIC